MQPVTHLKAPAVKHDDATHSDHAGHTPAGNTTHCFYLHEHLTTMLHQASWKAVDIPLLTSEGKKLDIS